MKSTMELEVALLGLRIAAQGENTHVDPSIRGWVDEALALNYWQHVCERKETEIARAGSKRRRPVVHAVADNAA